MCTLIIPALNEERFIGRCLDSILGTTYPRDRLEVLVVDGLSEDATRDIVRSYALRHPFIRLLDNPRRVTPAALNIGVQAARGSAVIPLGAHAEYPAAYITLCVTHLLESGADCVGGVIRTVPRTPGVVGQAIGFALSHLFGVGNSTFRTGATERLETDTVFGGCYRREVFQRIGLWNERLVYSQDLEFNHRLTTAGGTILLVPEIHSTYYARSDLASFVRHNFRNGLWAVLPLGLSRSYPMRWRHFIPLGFTAALLLCAALAPFATLFRWALALLAGAYGAMALGIGAAAAARYRDVRHLAVTPLVLATLHLPYGVGSLWGVVRLAGRALRGAGPRAARAT